ncbi:unnamed protein product [Vicia faba]|uniref:Mitochondrial protein n=1 Tax=Vicia faba TaxID=3906 RepID=A0AAV0ZR45_VICFA|nr:unnamed protein product [Vicia faba]
MWNCNHVKISIVLGTKLSNEREEKYVDATSYKQLVGCLMYLTVTRPDMMYVVCLISRFMDKPREEHMQITKRVLRSDRQRSSRQRGFSCVATGIVSEMDLRSGSVGVGGSRRAELCVEVWAARTRSVTASGYFDFILFVPFFSSSSSIDMFMLFKI